MHMHRRELIGLTRGELEQILAGLGEPAYRGRQLYRALYRERQWDLNRITAFPLALRNRMEQQFQAGLPAVEKIFQSADGTARYLLRLSDGKHVETVFMPEERRKTLCISTQVGCPIDCQFCLTGVMGFTRNLTAGEIVGQALRVSAESGIAPDERVNLVFM